MRAGADGRLTPLPIPAGEPLSPGSYPIPVPGQPRRSLLIVPPEAGAGHPPAPLLVFCHGAGGTAEGAAALIGEAAARAGVVLLLPASTGRTWDLILGGAGPDTLTLDGALQQAAARCRVDRHRVAIAGFSDGGSYALSLGLANGDLFSAVLAFSPGFWGPPRVQGRPRVFVSHGTDDAVLPIDRCGRRVVAQLRSADYPVTYEEFAGGHVVPPDVARTAIDWWLAGEPSAPGR